MKTLMFVLSILFLIGCNETISPDIEIEKQQSSVPKTSLNNLSVDTTKMLEPRNGSLVSQPVTFKWSKVKGATKYWLCASTDHWKTSLIINDSTLTDTAVTYTDLPYDCTITWNMATGNDSGWNTSAWTSESNFIIVPQHCWTDGVVMLWYVPLQKFNVGDIQTFLVATVSNPGAIGVSSAMTITAPDSFLVYFNERPDLGFTKSVSILPKVFEGINTIYQKRIEVKCVGAGSGNVVCSIRDNNMKLHLVPISVSANLRVTSVD